MASRLYQAPGPFINCHLKLNSKRDYYPGDVVKGQLIIAPTDIVYCHGIYVTLEGKAIVNFKVQGESRHKEEKFLREECYVLGENITHAGIKKMQLPVATQEFPFALEFPANVPSTFHGKFGIIEYQVVVYLVRSDTYHVKQTERTLNVKGTLDLQEEYPDTLHPVVFSPSSRKKPFKCTLQLDKRGYLPGEPMTFTIEVFNPEELVVEDITLTFVKKVIYKVRETKSAKATLAVLNKSSMDQCTPYVYTGVIQVPLDLYPTQFGRPIEIIDLQYAIQIVVSGPEMTLSKGELTIIIGCHSRPYNPEADDKENEENRHSLSQQNSQENLIRRPSTMGAHSRPKMDAHVTDTDRRGSASDLPDLGAAFSLLSFIPMTKSTSMEALKGNTGPPRSKES